MACSNNQNRKPTTYTGSPAGIKGNKSTNTNNNKPTRRYIDCLFQDAYNGDATAIKKMSDLYCGVCPTRGDIYNNPTRANLQIMYIVLIHNNPKTY